MKGLDKDVKEVKQENYCPNCGSRLGDFNKCPNCGVIGNPENFGIQRMDGKSKKYPLKNDPSVIVPNTVIANKKDIDNDKDLLPIEGYSSDEYKFIDSEEEVDIKGNEKNEHIKKTWDLLGGDD